MAAETAILDGDQRIGHIVGKIGEAGLVAAESALLGQHGAVGGQDHQPGLALRDGQHAILAERQPDIAEERREAEGAPQRRNETEAQQEAHERPAAPARRRCRGTRGRLALSPAALDQARLDALGPAAFPLCAKQSHTTPWPQGSGYQPELYD